MLRMVGIYIAGCVLFVVLAIALGTLKDSKQHKPLSVEEKLTKIAIIDSGFGPIEGSDAFKYLCKHGSYDFHANLPGVGIDDIGHGAIVTSLINAPIKSTKKCYLIYKVSFDESFYDDLPRAIDKAVEEGAEYINMSIITNFQNPDTRWAMMQAAKKNVKFFVASGNNARNLNDVCNFYPQCIDNLGENLILVGAQYLDTAERTEYSNYGARVTVWERGDFMDSYGTSFAAPRALGLRVSNVLDEQPLLKKKLTK